MNKYVDVFFTRDISPKGLLKVYNAVSSQRRLDGKIGVKISTGEAGGNNYLKPELIAPLVQTVNGTIVECNTAYKGKRTETADHWKTIEEHGFSKIAPVDIMDANGEKKIPVPDPHHLDFDIVGANFDSYNSFLVLSHFKGHAMAGFGGALKNIAIGMASANGKAYIHNGGKSMDRDTIFKSDHMDFLESMVDAVKAVLNAKGADHFIYINVANRLSVDCDCDSNPAEPMIPDIGIFGSIDPVAVDQACIDAIYQMPNPNRGYLVDRIESRSGTWTVEVAARDGLGMMAYNLRTLD